MAGCGCNYNGLSSGLIYRTPGQYLAAAKRLPDGPARIEKLRQAAIAYATANAARNGNLQGAAAGLGALRALGSAGTTQTLVSVVRDFGGSAEVRQVVATVAGATTAVSSVLRLVDLLPGIDRSVREVIRWVAWVLGGMLGTPPGLGEGAVDAFADFCHHTGGFLDDPGPLEDSIGSLLEGPLFNDRNAGRIARAVVRLLVLFRTRLCDSGPVRRRIEEKYLTAAPPPPPPPPPPEDVSPAGAWARLSPQERRAITSKVPFDVVRRSLPKPKTGPSPLLIVGGIAAVGAVIYVMR